MPGSIRSICLRKTRSLHNEIIRVKIKAVTRKNVNLELEFRDVVSWHPGKLIEMDLKKNIISIVRLCAAAILAAAPMSFASADFLDPSALLDKKLEELDHVMERRDTYYMRHEHMIDSLRMEAAKAGKSGDLRRMFDVNHALYEAYSSFQNDSARVYNDREMMIALRIGDKNLITRAQGDNLFTYMSRGDFTSAVEVLGNTDLSGVADSLKADFYVNAVRLYSDLSNFTSSSWEDKYAMKSRAYSDTVLQYASPGSFAAQFATNFLYGYKINGDQRVATYESMLRRTDISDSMKAMLHSMLGDVYISLGNRDLGLAHKVESAIIDIKEAKRETTSKQFLACELYEQGDIERASRYIHSALEDAESYNAPQRKAEIGRTLSLIESSRYKTVNSEKRTLWIMLALSILLVVIVAGGYLYIRSRNKQLRLSKKVIEKKNEQITEANENLSRLNGQLNDLNMKLRESVKIKDEYIGYGFYLNSEFIGKLEGIYKLVNRKVAVGQGDDLKNMLRLSDIKAEKSKMLKEFDRIFLTLFPTFIDQYRELFPPGDTVLDDVEEGILTPEMRIFALIRLGINDNGNIARFLNYSVNTINTYKTKAKKRSLVANEEFEVRIMEIRSVR